MSVSRKRTNETPHERSSKDRASATTGKKASGITFMDSSALDQARYTPTWLVESILVKRQPGVIGGPKKSMKTSLMLDLAISLGSGKSFLGRFRVPRRRRVAVFSGESGEATIRETAQRICASKGVALADCDVLWQFNLPRLNCKFSRQALKTAIKSNKIEVVFIDPLYLCLGDVSASNLYEVGPVLYDLAKACLSAGATPVLVHHARKRQERKDRKPLDLEDLAFSGIGEFARQWLLINRREDYEPGLGTHHLTLSTGGSAGHSDLWSVDIEEGCVGDDFRQRVWEVSVNGDCSPTVARQKELRASQSYYDEGF